MGALISNQTTQREIKLQAHNCQKFDKFYGNRKKRSVFEAHVQWQKNQFCPQKNAKGIINFGTSVNAVIPKTTLKYLPSYFNETDCQYPNPLGKDSQLNGQICKDTPFNQNQTFSFNNLNAILSQFCYSYKQVHFLGFESINQAILTHSGAKVVPETEAQLIIVKYSTKQKINELRQKSKGKTLLILLQKKQQYNQFQTINRNEAYAYDFALKKPLTMGIVQSHDQQILAKLSYGWGFAPVSNVVRKASLTPDLEISVDNASNQIIRKMIQIDSGVLVGKQNLWITTGATAALDNISRCIFKGGNLCLDSPYYLGFDHDFKYSGVKIVHKLISEKTKLIQRIKLAHCENAVGYVICNPHNPTGTMLLPEQVKEICEWAKSNPKFHLIFDQVYLNTCRNKQTLTAAKYAIQLPNIHVVRSFAKDFGLCGFKIGIAISSNEAVRKNFDVWKQIISHHPYTLSVVNKMLLQSKHGQEIITKGKQILKSYFQIIFEQLDRIGVKYVKPEAGCFVFGDFKKFMSQPTQDEENLLWKKMFYKYRVNISCGTYFHASGPGFFRICPLIDEPIMKTGLARIQAAVTEIKAEEEAN